MNLFTLKGITGAPMSQIIRGSAPFVILMLLGLAIMLAFPGLSTWLPYVAGYKG